MKYSDLIKVNENFQYSVNLQFDINNISKLKEYIPTKDGCEILKFYFQSVLQEKNRATTLIGPYGKGKSHLLLVFLTLLGNYEKENLKIIDEFLLKVSKVDEELALMIKEVRKNKIRLMPVIINSNYDDIHQAFLLGLSEALEREKISNTVLKTYFDIALGVINTWQTEYKEVLGDFKKCLETSHISLKTLQQGLKSFSKKHYEIFKEVYRCVSRGQEFEPLVNMDLIKTYKDITYELSGMGYTGIFIAFDEFSKFLESANDATIMRDLKILQDFAELASRTGKNEQIHLSCITHKGMNEYLKHFDSQKANSFKTVEGRFKTIYFNRSMEQNYEIVSYALKKEKSFNAYYENFYQEHKVFYEQIKKLDVFKNTDNIEKILFKGCFPLNPITTYSLTLLSEKIAQNERTLFTFLTDDDMSGLKHFIQSSAEHLFPIDKIYDYFSPLLKKEMEEVIRTIWIKSENALRKNISEEAKKIVKAIAVISMIHNLDEFSCSDDVLRLSTGLSNTSYDEAIQELLEKSILRRKKITDELDFATMFNRKLTKDIKELTEDKFSHVDEKKVLNEIMGSWYSIPRRYNENFKMTRFFLNLFMTEEELLSLSSFDLFFETNYCDGIVIHLIKNSKDISQLKQHFFAINDGRAVLKISKFMFSKMFSNWLREYEAIKYLKAQNLESSDLNDELQMMQEEVVEAISNAVKEYISEENIFSCCYLDVEDKKVKYLSSILSFVCESLYYATPIINNELINKREITAPIKKAREIVIDCILNRDPSLIQSKTSSEATIYKAIAMKSDVESVKNVLDFIKDFIHKSDNEKKCFRELYEILLQKPYAIRKGILPVLLAMALKDYVDNVILYYMNREIDLNSLNLVKINDNPEKFYILTEKGIREKLNYIRGLMSIFEITNIENSLRIQVYFLVDEMKKWILGLSRLLKEVSVAQNLLHIKEEYIVIKSELLRPDLNNNEFLFTTLPDLFSHSYDSVLTEVREMKQLFDHFMDQYFGELIQESKNILNKSYQGSLVTLLKELYETVEADVSKRILDSKTKSFLEYISTLQTHDENKVVNKMAKIVTGFYVEDWQPSDKKNYVLELTKIFENLNKTKEETQHLQKIILIHGDQTMEKDLAMDFKISALGTTMKNNIEEILEEYGGSLSEQEKINVLLEIMKQFM